MIKINESPSIKYINRVSLMSLTEYQLQFMQNLLVEKLINDSFCEYDQHIITFLAII